MNVKAIEELPLLYWQKALMLLVGSGIKKSSDVSALSGVLTNMKEKDEFLRKRKSFKKTLKELLPACDIPFKLPNLIQLKGTIKPYQVYIQPLYVAESNKTLDELSDLIYKEKSDDEHRKLAELFSFPKTAIDNFLGKKDFYQFDRPPCNIRPMFCFRMSNEHYESELLLLQSWFNKVNELSPFIYQGLMKNKTYCPPNSSQDVIDILKEQYWLLNEE